VPIFTIEDELMERSFVMPYACPVNHNGLPYRPLRSNKSDSRVSFFALTKEAFRILILLSSLGIWAAIWAVAASLASALLQ
jgi:hypothetical protein